AQGDFTAAQLCIHVDRELFLLLRAFNALINPLAIQTLITIFQTVKDLLTATGFFTALTRLKAPNKLLGLGDILLLRLEVLHLKLKPLGFELQLLLVWRRVIFESTRGHIECAGSYTVEEVTIVRDHNQGAFPLAQEALKPFE